jgi:hypothetical protein
MRRRPKLTCDRDSVIAGSGSVGIVAVAVVIRRAPHPLPLTQSDFHHSRLDPVATGIFGLTVSPVFSVSAAFFAGVRLAKVVNY